jgi:DMSO/TMAO reductase YedYZ molybdopterin-dependent catalytic subunit
MNRTRLRAWLSAHGTELGVAALAAVAALAGSLLAVGITPAFVVASAAAVVLELTPDSLIAVGIGTLRDFAKPLLAAGSTVLLLLLYTALVFGVGRVVDSSEAAGRRTGVTLLAVFAATYLITGSLLSSVGAGIGAAVAALAGSAAFDPIGVSQSRRRLLRAGAAAAGAVGIGAFVQAGSGGDGTAVETDIAPAAQSLLDDADDLSFYFPNMEPMISQDFYQVDISTANPDISPEQWSVSVTGLVEEEQSYTLSDLKEFPAERRFVTLRCVSDTMNGTKMDTALWTGVPITDLLDDAGAPESCCVTLHGADDYYVSFPREALDPGLFAYKMNGRRLPRGHGYPLRTLVPGHWGETNAKWLTEIEIREEPEDGYWESRGWEGTGEVHTVAKLHGTETSGESIRVGGHAYAGTRGISAVELSTDGGDTWVEAMLSDRLPGATPVEDGTTEPTPDGEAKDAWRMWEYEYEKSGEHEVVVRAVDGTGTVQPREEQDTFPEGATGWVRKTIQP